MIALGIMTAPRSRAVDPNNPPKPFDIIMWAGADYEFNTTITDTFGAAVDLAGNSYAAQFRSAPYPTGVLYANFSTSAFTTYSSAFTTYSSAFTTYSSAHHIYTTLLTTHRPRASRVSLRLPWPITRALSGKTGVWDLVQVNTIGKIRYLMGGKAFVRPTSTVLP
jgi:hypothetical protein